MCVHIDCAGENKFTACIHIIITLTIIDSVCDTDDPAVLNTDISPDASGSIYYLTVFYYDFLSLIDSAGDTSSSVISTLFAFPLTGFRPGTDPSLYGSMITVCSSQSRPKHICP